MDNIWFYTLSTAAQVLAALAGLFAVFVVWKVQDIDRFLFDIRRKIISLISDLSRNIKEIDPIKAENLYSMSDSEILNKFSELLTIKMKEPERMNVSYEINDDTITYALDEFTENLYKNNINKRLNILADLKIVLIINFFVISVCLIVLTFSSIICSKFIVLVVICFAVLYCLYLIGNRIYKITTG